MRVTLQKSPLCTRLDFNQELALRNKAAKRKSRDSFYSRQPRQCRRTKPLLSCASAAFKIVHADYVFANSTQQRIWLTISYLGEPQRPRPSTSPHLRPVKNEVVRVEYVVYACLFFLFRQKESNQERKCVPRMLNFYYYLLTLVC